MNGKPAQAEPRTTARKVAETSDLVGKVVDTFQAAPEALSKLDPEGLGSAARFAHRLTPLGWLANGTEVVSGIADDRRRMPMDEAIANNVGRKAVQEIGGAIGTAYGGYKGAQAGRILGAPGAAAGGVVGGLTGKWTGERVADPYAERVLPAYRAAKAGIKTEVESARQLLRKLTVLGTPKYYLDQNAAKRRMVERGY